MSVLSPFGSRRRFSRPRFRSRRRLLGVSFEWQFGVRRSIPSVRDFFFFWRFGFTALWESMIRFDDLVGGCDFENFSLRFRRHFGCEVGVTWLIFPIESP